jgi:hypothetical protein
MKTTLPGLRATKPTRLRLRRPFALQSSCSRNYNVSSSNSSNNRLNRDSPSNNLPHSQLHLSGIDLPSGD